MYNKYNDLILSLIQMLSDVLTPKSEMASHDVDMKQSIPPQQPTQNTSMRSIGIQCSRKFKKTKKRSRGMLKNAKVIYGHSRLF